MSLYLLLQKTDARSKGLEPSISAVTGRRFNQLSYDRNMFFNLGTLTVFFLSSKRFGEIAESNERPDYIQYKEWPTTDEV
jgi:hypothetical protein